MSLAINIPIWASQLIINKGTNDWYCCLTCGDYKNSSTKGYECRSAIGKTPQEAMDLVIIQFDFNSPYWQKLEKI